MSENSNNLPGFLQELKRRKVIRVISVYAAAAFVILELVDIITPNLGLPVWTFNLVLILLCAGFIITVIVSWIYDIHPEGGIVKTEPSHKVETKESSKESAGWKIASYISFGVILVMVSVLLYPKIFKTDKFKELRDDSGLITLAVLPFDNLTADSSLYYWQNGISEYLINRLAGSDELAVSSSQVVSDVLAGTRQVATASLAPDVARRTASKINASTHVTGNFIGTGDDLSIMLNLVNTENGELIWSTSVDGDLGGDYRTVLNRLSDTVRNYLEIKALENNSETDLSNAFPNSAEAYRHYIDGLHAIVSSRYGSAIESLTKAFEIDTTFTFAAFYLAFTYSFSGEFGENMYQWTRRAYELKDNLPPEYRPWIELWYACYITKDHNDIRDYCNMMYEAALHSRFLWFDLGVTYESYLDDYTKSISAYEELEALNKQWGDDWRFDRYYEEYTSTLLKAGRPGEVERVADIGLRVNPENDLLVRVKGAAAILMNDSASVHRYREEFVNLARSLGDSEALIEHKTGNMYLWIEDYMVAMNHYRRAYELDAEMLFSLEQLIYCQLRSNLNVEECLMLSEYGLEQKPEGNYFLWGKGFSLHKLGRNREALSILRELEERIPANKEVKRDIQEVERALAL